MRRSAGPVLQPTILLGAMRQGLRPDRVTGEAHRAFERIGFPSAAGHS